MASLKALKIRIGSVKSTQKITKALNMVAAAKLRRATQMAQAARPYSTRMSEVVASLASHVTPSPQSPKLLTGTGKDDVHLIVVVTGDRGLAGAFNSNIVRAARKKADELQATGKTVLFYIAGRKGKPVLQRVYPKAIIAEYDTSQTRSPTYEEAQAIAQDIIDRFTSDRIDVVHLAYALFKSTLVQEPTIDQIIPVAPPATAADDTAKGSTAPAAVEYEPDEDEILADLLDQLRPACNIVLHDRGELCGRGWRGYEVLRHQLLAQGRRVDNPDDLTIELFDDGLRNPVGSQDREPLVNVVSLQAGFGHRRQIGLERKATP